ncbi:leucine-rich repeat-containing protein 27 isoform X2 [Monodelphis domestica]|uniref:leucine-rich repeat-containing protein 27 isoform X2 n=1 Tax=Monodelphis domestica TaxID=13616 RepID=UPI0024E1CFC3|nr:leucine-rich repeat-containing protein 27 isoform X2 [Monodelphis domestica]
MEGGYSAPESPPPPLTLLDFTEGGAGKARTLSITLPKDVQNVIEGLLFSPSLILDLSKRGLAHLNEEIFKVPHLKLHLQRNELSIIPKDFFQLLPSLVWLDLRHNQIQAIPSGIGAHKNLKTLLMEKNPIKSLPVELGNLMSLKALNLRNCPLEFPPQDVVQKGLVAILAFLRTWALKHVVDAGPLYQEIVPMKRANSFKESSKGKRSSPERPASTKEALPLWRPRPEAPKGREYSFPPVEKLNLADVGEPSMDFSEDWANEEEMKQFWKLRQEIVANEKAEILANQLLPVQFPLELGEALPNRRGKERPQKPRSNFRIPLKRPHNPRKKISSFKNMFPEIPSYETAIQTRKDEDRRVAALKELKEKQALIEQRKRDKKMLQKWREQAAAMKKEKEALMTVQPPPMDLVLMNAPFATDPLAEKKELDSLKKKQLNQWKLRPEKDELRASKDLEIEERIKQHMQALQERRRRARGTPQEEMQGATQDLEIARKLHDDVVRRYLEPDLRREYRFTAFTGDVNLHSPVSRSQNIFLNMKF